GARVGRSLLHWPGMSGRAPGGKTRTRAPGRAAVDAAPRASKRNTVPSSSTGNGPAVDVSDVHAGARRDSRSTLPSVDALLRSAPARKASDRFGRANVKRQLRSTLDGLRMEASDGLAAPDDDVILARAIGDAARDWYGLSEVINATGVL